MGFGQATGIDITSEQRGILPSRAWKRAKLGQPWYPGETLSVGIGQGYMAGHAFAIGSGGDDLG